MTKEQLIIAKMQGLTEGSTSFESLEGIMLSWEEDLK